MIEEHLPCDKFDCTFFIKFVTDSAISIKATVMPHVFQNYHRTCLACTHFKRFDMYEKEENELQKV